MTRIAFDVSAIPQRLTGAGVFVARLVEALAATGDVDLELVARRDDAARWSAFGNVHALAPTPRPARLLWEQRGGPAAARTTGADVWHGPHYTLPLRVPLPSVVTVHDLTFFDHPEKHERSKVLFFRRMIRAACWRADTVVCVSDRTARRLHELVRVRGETVTIPHGVDTARFTPDGHAESRGYPYVLYVGTIEPRKNVDGLVRAFARLRRAHPDLHLVLAGLPGWGARDVDVAINRTRSHDRVERLGYYPDEHLASLIRGASAFVYPAVEEGFGLPVLEALACGVPVVTTEDTVMADVAGGAALLAPRGDEEALAAAIDAALTDPEPWRAAGPAVAGRFTWAAAATAHADLYRGLAR